MITKPTLLSERIYNALKQNTSSAVFLCKQDAGPKLTFGPNRTTLVNYQIMLTTEDQTIVLTPESCPHFALLMDSYGHNAVQLVLYIDGISAAPVLEYNSDDPDCRVISGNILILAHDEHGPGQAVIHATFASSGKSSMVIDGSPELYHHLRTAVASMEGGSSHECTKDSSLDPSLDLFAQ